MLKRLVSLAKSPRGRIGASLSVANYLQAAVGFVVNFYLANALGAEGYGILSYGIVLGTMLYTSINFGAERTLVRDLVQRPDRPAILTASLTLRAVLGALAMAAVVSYLQAADLPHDKARVILLCSLASVFWALGPVAWFDAHYRMHWHALITLLERAAYAAAVIVAFENAAAPGVVLAAGFLMASRIGSFLVQMAVTRRTFRFDRAGLTANIRWLARGNALIVLAALANLMISHWNQLVLEHRLSAERLGYYALAFQMIAVVTLLQTQILRLFFPRIAAVTAQGEDPFLASRKMTRYVLFGTVLSLAAVVPLTALAPAVISALFDPEYLQALPPLRILAAWAVFNGGARIVNAFLINLRLDQTFFWSALLAGSIAVVLGLVLIPRYGEVGVALALLISHPVSVAAQFIRVRREFRRRQALWTSPAAPACEE